MRSLPWDREREIKRVRSRIWRHLTPAAQAEAAIRPDAARLLQLSETDVSVLAQLHFLLSEEVGNLLEDLPRLVRRLATTTVAEEERSQERVRGAISWGRTLAGRLSTGTPHLYVTTPSQRAYQTPENELLVAVLDAVVKSGRRTGWAERSAGVGGEVARRTAGVDEMRRRRALAEIERVPPTTRSVARVRTGRHARRYRTVVAAYDRYQALVSRLEHDALRDAIEQRALVTRDDATLFEITGTFDLLDGLRRLGWNVPPLRLFGAPRALRLRATRGAETLRLWYQHVPPELSRGSTYVGALRHHWFSSASVQPLRPDMVLLHQRPAGETRWIIGEAKLGTRRTVGDSARAALTDLLAYRRDFRVALDQQAGPFGLGLAWGQELQPATEGELVLCTPDTIAEALRILIEGRLADGSA